MAVSFTLLIMLLHSFIHSHASPTTDTVFVSNTRKSQKELFETLIDKDETLYYNNDDTPYSDIDIEFELRQS
jgi:hypothetical protein